MDKYEIGSIAESCRDDEERAARREAAEREETEDETIDPDVI